MIRAILFFLPCFIFAEATLKQLHFSDFPAHEPASAHPIWSWQGQKVQMRGFWYPLSAETGVLSDSPQVKSCCLKSPAKIYQQVVVTGNVSTQSQRAVTLQGIFRIAPLYNHEGKMIQYYLLEQAEEMPAPGFPKLSLLLICSAGLLVGLRYIKRLG